MKMPLAGWLALALIASLIVNAFQWRGAAVSAVKADAKVEVAADANAGAMGVVRELKDSVAECFVGRAFDRAANAAAMEERAKAREQIQRATAAARTQTAADVAGHCAEWAAQPACGVTR